MREPSPRLGALVSVSVHLLAGATLLSYEPARSALLAAAPIMVDWIAPPAAKPVPPAPAPRAKSVPRPAAAAPVAELPVLSTPAAAAHVEGQPAVEKPQPTVAAAPPVPTASIAAQVAEPVAIVPPVFDAAYLDNAPPPYPYLSRRTGEQGRVVLRVRVSSAGTAEDVEVRNSSGHTRLDQAAREAVRLWKFVPARRGGTPVPATVLVPVSFRLEG